MSEPINDRWTWRERARDPRFPASVALMAASAVLGAVVLGFDLSAGIIVVGAGALVALIALPPWRDPKHGPAAGAAVLGGGALLVLAVAWLVG